MKEWFSIVELASSNLPGLPRTEKSIDNYARAKWRGFSTLTRQVSGKTKSIWEYHISLLPEAARLRLKMLYLQPVENRHEEKTRQELERQIWARYNSLSDVQKSICKDRLKVITAVFEFTSTLGLTLDASISMVSQQTGCSVRTIYNWLEKTRHYDRDIWLAVLAPEVEQMATSERAECHASAWEYLKSDFLRPEKPAFSACYRRMIKVAKERKWAPIPSERALRRRLDSEVTKAVQVLAREGKEKAKTLFPAQRRTRSHLHAMQAVNMDGHKLDVFVTVPGFEKPVRMLLLGIQDLYSGKLVAWRLTETECKEAVRLVIGDMVEQWVLIVTEN